MAPISPSTRFTSSEELILPSFEDDDTDWIEDNLYNFKKEIAEEPGHEAVRVLRDNGKLQKIIKETFNDKENI